MALWQYGKLCAAVRSLAYDSPCHVSCPEAIDEVGSVCDSVIPSQWQCLVKCFLDLGRLQSASILKKKIKAPEFAFS